MQSASQRHFSSHYLNSITKDFAGIQRLMISKMFLFKILMTSIERKISQHAKFLTSLRRNSQSYLLKYIQCRLVRADSAFHNAKEIVKDKWPKGLVSKQISLSNLTGTSGRTISKTIAGLMSWAIYQLGSLILLVFEKPINAAPRASIGETESTRRCYEY